MRRCSSARFSVPRSFSWKMSSRRRRSFVHLEKSQAKVFTTAFPLCAHPTPRPALFGCLALSVMAITILGFHRRDRGLIVLVPWQGPRRRARSPQLTGTTKKSACVNRLTVGGAGKCEYNHDVRARSSFWPQEPYPKGGPTLSLSSCPPELPDLDSGMRLRAKHSARHVGCTLPQERG